MTFIEELRKKTLLNLISDLKEHKFETCSICNANDVKIRIYSVPGGYYNESNINELIVELKDHNKFDSNCISVSKPISSYIAEIIKKYCGYYLSFKKYTEDMIGYFESKYSSGCSFLSTIYFKNELSVEEQRKKSLSNLIKDLKECKFEICTTCSDNDIHTNIYLVPGGCYDESHIKELITELEKHNNGNVKEYISLSKPVTSYIAEIINKHCSYTLSFTKLRRINSSYHTECYTSYGIANHFTSVIYLNKVY